MDNSTWIEALNSEYSIKKSVRSRNCDKFQIQIRGSDLLLKSKDANERFNYSRDSYNFLFPSIRDIDKQFSLLWISGAPTILAVTCVRRWSAANFLASSRHFNGKRMRHGLPRWPFPLSPAEQSERFVLLQIEAARERFRLNAKTSSAFFPPLLSLSFPSLFFSGTFDAVLFMFRGTSMMCTRAGVHTRPAWKLEQPENFDGGTKIAAGILFFLFPPLLLLLFHHSLCSSLSLCFSVLFSKWNKAVF